MIASAITTTGTKYDNLGEPMMAEGYEVNTLRPSTPFDFGAGIVNPSRAMDPGLVLSSGIFILLLLYNIMQNQNKRDNFCSNLLIYLS